MVEQRPSFDVVGMGASSSHSKASMCSDRASRVKAITFSCRSAISV